MYESSKDALIKGIGWNMSMNETGIGKQKGCGVQKGPGWLCF
jgi:hypothetical protein